MFFKSIVTSGLLSLFIAMPALADARHCGDTELSKLMEGMKTDLKAYVTAFKADDQDTMQQMLDKLIASTAQSRELVPLKLAQMDKGKPAAQMDHSQMDHSQMGHDMPGMEGMSHQTHAEHMKYIQGIDKLDTLLKQLKTTKDNATRKQLLGALKKHSKASHKAFRMKCDS